MNNIFAVVALIMKDNKILAVSRKDNHNDFGLIGGKVDDGEDIDQALIREVKEEVGIYLIDFEMILDRYVSETNNKICRVFLVKSYSGEPKSLEGAVVKWVEPKELTTDNCSFRDYNINLLNKMGIKY